MGNDGSKREAAARLARDFRDRLAALLDDLDAAGEELAAMHVEQAIAKLSDG